MGSGFRRNDELGVVRLREVAAELRRFGWIPAFAGMTAWGLLASGGCGGATSLRLDSGSRRNDGAGSFGSSGEFGGAASLRLVATCVAPTGAAASSYPTVGAAQAATATRPITAPATQSLSMQRRNPRRRPTESKRRSANQSKHRRPQPPSDPIHRLTAPARDRRLAPAAYTRDAPTASPRASRIVAIAAINAPPHPSTQPFPARPPRSARSRQARCAAGHRRPCRPSCPSPAPAYPGSAARRRWPMD